MALFIVIPPLLTHTLQLSAHQQTLLYLIVLAVAFIGTVPLIIIAEKKTADENGLDRRRCLPHPQHATADRSVSLWLGCWLHPTAVFCRLHPA